MDKQAFCTNYIADPTERAMAIALLTEGDRSIEDWRKVWAKKKSEPVPSARG